VSCPTILFQPVTNPNEDRMDIDIRRYSIAIRMLTLNNIISELDPMIELHCNDHQYRCFLEFLDAWEEYAKNNDPTREK